MAPSDAPSAAAASAAAAAAAEEDDYLTMSFDDAPAPAAETSLQRTARLKREAAARAHQLSKKDLAAKAARDQQAVLNTALDSSNSLGARMLAKMGYKEGETLGKAEGALREPIRVHVRERRRGIGEEEKVPAAGGKRSAEGLESEEAAEKRRKIVAKEYRERAQLSAEERRLKGQLEGAMKVLETMETEAEAKKENRDDRDSAGSENPSHPLPAAGFQPLRSINILRRPLARDRLRAEYERTAQLLKADAIASRDPLDDSMTGRPSARQAFLVAAEDELEEEDSELEEFEELDLAEQLEKVVMHLRTEYRYCYWCMGSYPDAEMDGCPGLTEDEHG